MTRLVPSLALAALLVAPEVALADGPRAQSHARDMLGQMIELPVVRGDRFRAPLADLQGDWVLERLRVDRIGMVRVGGGRDRWFRIDRDGDLAVSVGCNRQSARIESGRHGTIAIGPLRSTRMACPRDEARLERALSEALPSVARYDLNCHGLTLLDQHGRVMLELSRRPDAHPWRELRCGMRGADHEFPGMVPRPGPMPFPHRR